MDLSEGLDPVSAGAQIAADLVAEWRQIFGEDVILATEGAISALAGALAIWTDSEHAASTLAEVAAIIRAADEKRRAAMN
jgi:hypothetical protein